MKKFILVALAVIVLVAPGVAMAISVNDIVAAPLKGQQEIAMAKVLVAQVNSLNARDLGAFMATYDQEGKIQTQAWGWLSWTELRDKMSSAMGNIEGFGIGELKILFNEEMGVAVATYQKWFDTPYGRMGGSYKAEFKKNNGQWVIVSEAIID